MRFKKLTALVCTVVIQLSFTMPAFANTDTDEIGAATTVYQHYLTDRALSEIQLNSNVPGRSPQAETYIGNVLNLSTRLLPFSFDANISYYADISPTTFFITFRNRNYNDLNQQVQSKVKQMATQATVYDTDYQKLRYINNYLVDHCEYQEEALTNPDLYSNAYTAFGCLIEGKAVCEGYANSVQLLCEEMNIPCMKVTGSAYGGDHIWNAVYLNNKWWMLDVTFNDPLGSQSKNDRWEYFLLTPDDLKQKGTHEYDQDYFEMSKEIYTGHTKGQLDVTVPFNNLSLRNSSSSDVPDNSLTKTPSLTTEQKLTATEKESTSSIIIDKATETKATVLKEQGLFMGDENGFRLADTMTRIEMGVMVMRMNDGLVSLKKNGDYYANICPFTDVPQWAKSSIGFLYDNKLIAGQSTTLFGSGNVTKQDYAIMMMRVLGIEHSYEDALAIAVTHGILTEEQASGNSFALRADIVNMTYATLQLQKQQQQKTT